MPRLQRWVSVNLVSHKVILTNTNIWEPCWATSVPSVREFILRSGEERFIQKRVLLTCFKSTSKHWIYSTLVEQNINSNPTCPVSLACTSKDLPRLFFHITSHPFELKLSCPKSNTSKIPLTIIHTQLCKWVIRNKVPGGQSLSNSIWAHICPRESVLAFREPHIYHQSVLYPHLDTSSVVPQVQLTALLKQCSQNRSEQTDPCMF